MKTYLKTIIIVLVALISFNSFAQEEVKKIEITFEVAGTCGMCKTRIEESLDIKGVKFAEWNKETHQCKVIFDPRKISEDEIHQAITKVGHDTDKIKATDEEYNNLHGCCHYVRIGETEQKH